MEHTLLPWRNESGILHADYPNPTDTVHPARCENEADAEFVERAVNNHYKLLTALEAIFEADVPMPPMIILQAHNAIKEAKK